MKHKIKKSKRRLRDVKRIRNHYRQFEQLLPGNLFGSEQIHIWGPLHWLV